MLVFNYLLKYACVSSSFLLHSGETYTYETCTVACGINWSKKIVQTLSHLVLLNSK